MNQFRNFSFTDNRDLLRNIQLEASAGTGKTYSIERIVSLLIAADSLSISQILIVTFTRKAARELKERIRTILLSASRTGKLDLGGEKRTLDTGEMENIQKAVLEFEKASIFTIHSFCLNMLKAYPFESLSQFSMDMDSRDDLTGETVRDYMREIGRLMNRGQLLKYKAFLNKEGYEKAVENLADALDRELFEPDVRLIPDRTEMDEVLDSIMEFNSEKGELFRSWKKMISLLPEADHLEALGFGNLRWKMPKIQLLSELPGEVDFISVSKALSEGNIVKTLLDFLPQNLEKSLKKKFDPEIAAADPFVRSVEDFLNIYVYDENKPGSDLYSRILRTSFLIEAYEKIKGKLKRKKDITGKLDFNDLIGRLHEGLCGGKNQIRPELITEIRKRYRTVLIDEFQDTDSRQWDIFKILFGDDDGHNFFLVGDPKQSIYRFRGADLEVYHKACHSDEVDGHYTLGRNFRSVSSLVQSVNTIFTKVFSREMHCGSTERTPFLPVEAGNPDEPRLNDGKAVFEFIRIASQTEEKSGISSLTTSKNLYYQLISYKCLNLLNSDIFLGDRRVKPGDIAILTESNKECLTLQGFLTSYSIPSVINARERIFDTAEADEFLLFLQALMRMDNSSVKLLLLTRFFPFSPVEVEVLERSGDMDRFSGLILRLRELVDRGKIIEASREFFDYRDLPGLESGFEERILAVKNGERSYSNVRQILEFLHREQQEGRLNTEKLFSLLLEKINGKSGMDEDLIRLDKDSEAVQIMTMHASKGLEFPIVFFAGALKKDTGSGLMDHYDYVEGGERCYDFLKLERNKVLQSMDLWEEKKRLYYVALTRASSKLYMPSVENLEQSYLSSLYSSFSIDDIRSLLTDHKAVESFNLPLHSGLVFRKSHKELKNLKTSIAETVDQGILKIIKEDPDLFSVDTDLESEFQNLKDLQNLRYRESGKELSLVEHKIESRSGFGDRYLKVSSYSSLIRDAGSKHAPKAGDDADRDDVSENVPAEQKEETLTRGAVLGELVHLLFEQLDYSLVRNLEFEDFSKSEDVEVLFQNLSVRFFNNRWYGQYNLLLKRLIYRTLKNGIQKGFSLCHLEEGSRIHEMEFHMTVKNCDELVLGRGFNGRVEEGYLKGFIDLIFIYEGRYYIADWKTTSSPMGDHFDAYGKDILDEMMLEHHYDLQSMIYITALYRYLSVTENRTFDYDRDFGGCYYFFVRGMSGHEDSDRGVHFFRPEKEVLLRFASQFISQEPLV